MRNSPLSDVSLALFPGELLCVLGPNGAGKSTLLRVMSALLPPSDGTVRLFGADARAMDRPSVARTVAVVPQHPDVAAGFRVRDVVMMGRAPHQGAWLRPRPEDHAVVDASLARCDLGPLQDRRVDELSGGEQKRVAIARALAQRPRVLLLDEPGAFLDLRHQLDLYELLAEEVSTSGLACAVVVHDLTVAAQFATKVALLRGGRLVASGAVDEVMTYRTLSDTFDVDLYVGVMEGTGARFFLPLRRKGA